MELKRLILVLGGLLLGLPLRAPASTQVGFAVRDITPPGKLSGICLGGYGPCKCRQATGINDRLYVRAMALYSSRTDTPVVIASMDLIGASNRVLTAILSKVNQPRPLLPATNIILTETHSHAAPDLVGLWGKVPEAYKSFVIEQAAAAIRDAFNGRVDATLSVSTGSFGESSNRRGWNGTDRDVVVLDAKTAATGARIGTIVNYASHPAILRSGNTLISRDWVGYMVEQAEASLGANKVMFINGAEGDVVPKTDVTGGTTELEKARSYGQAVARAVLAALAAGQAPVGDLLKFSRAPFNQCVTNPNFLNAALFNCIDYEMQGGARCAWSGLVPPRRVVSQVAYLRLGSQVQVAVVPGEALTRMSIDGVGAPGLPASSGSIKATMKAPVKMIFGMATDFLGYFVPRDEWNNPKASKNPANRDYEEGVSLGGDEANVWIRDRVKALIASDNPTF